MTTSARRGGTLGRELRAMYAFVERNANLIKRYWAWELVWLAYSLVNALSITFIGKAFGTTTTILFLLVGTLVWHYLALVFDLVSESIQWERWEGTIEYTFMAPISRLTHLLGQAAFAVLYGVLHTVVIMGIVALFFQVDLGKANFPSMLLIVVAGSMSFVGLGMLAGAGMRELFIPAILPLLVTGVVMIPLGLYAFMRAERYAKETGKLKRSG